MSLNEWHQVIIDRSNQAGSMIVDEGSPVRGTAPVSVMLYIVIIHSAKAISVTQKMIYNVTSKTICVTQKKKDLRNSSKYSNVVIYSSYYCSHLGVRLISYANHFVTYANRFHTVLLSSENNRDARPNVLLDLY